jgi:hypothetical protein
MVAKLKLKEICGVAAILVLDHWLAQFWSWLLQICIANCSRASQGLALIRT